MLPNSVFNVYDVCRNRVLLSSYGRQQGAMAITHIVLGVFLIPLINKWEDGFIIIVVVVVDLNRLGFLLGSPLYHNFNV